MKAATKSTLKAPTWKLTEEPIQVWALLCLSFIKCTGKQCTKLLVSAKWPQVNNKMTEAGSGIVLNMITGWAKDRRYSGNNAQQETVSQSRSTAYADTALHWLAFCSFSVQFLADYSFCTSCKYQISSNCTTAPLTSLLNLTETSMGVVHLQKSGLCTKYKHICLMWTC